MPYLEVAGDRLHYRTDGDAAHPCVVLSNSLGTDLSMWDAQAAALATDHYVVRYDARGHGQSPAGSAPVDLARLGQDVIALLDHLHIDRAAFCGISMGGMTGQWLGIHAPQRFTQLVLANTAARIGSADGWLTRAAQVRQDGMAAIADGAAARWFTPAFIEREPAIVAQLVDRLREQDAGGYAACCEALAHADLRADVASITAPCMIVAGLSDPVTTPADGAWLQQQIPGAKLTTLPASHISNIEAGAAFSALLRAYLE
ncbi:3-oxoadipate enol-lactonase [Pseudoduganella sp. FT25W]|uniref:3-oxoadipate enol-lactonase n=1 Tax=Duganella alba TaxID=2666081 RepID=A0A6L5QMI2_9BURK|nr:3-oxoadipate enol-lactonase [Duganella alba]MRX10161.1 3-oxoadipate enol-lactonase [Duganella alba]MRX16651.1 3-oxoadipate enol-lactonase [Duganella alba]